MEKFEQQESSEITTDLVSLKNSVKNDMEKMPKVPDEYLAANKKFKSFLYSSVDSNNIEDKEMSLYHFDSIKRGKNIKPHPKMLVAELKTLRKDLKEEIDKYLQENPPKVLELQKTLNKWMRDGEHVKKTESHLIYYPYVDVEKLQYILKGTGVELIKNIRYHEMGRNVTYKIKEDGILGPQTIAAIYSIREMYHC